MKVKTICLKINLLILKKTANLLKFEIAVNKHGEYYDFENSEVVFHDFMKIYVRVLNRLV